MRRALTRPGLLIVVVISAAFYLQWMKFTASAGSAPRPLDGEAAAAQLINPPLAQLASDSAADARFSASVAVSGDTIMLGAIFSGSDQQGEAYVFKNNCGPPLSAFASVSGASFDAASGVSPESIAAGFGHGARQHSLVPLAKSNQK
jgi:FG-GAP repeat